MTSDFALYVCETEASLDQIGASWEYEFTDKNGQPSQAPFGVQYVAFRNEACVPALLFEVSEWVAKREGGNITWRARFSRRAEVGSLLLQKLKETVFDNRRIVAYATNNSHFFSDCFSTGALNKPTLTGLTLREAAQGVAKRLGVKSESVSITFSNIE